MIEFRGLAFSMLINHDYIKAMWVIMISKINILTVILIRLTLLRFMIMMSFIIIKVMP